ncbi:GPR1/FUN34/yaaH family-domain-containing protein [Abortiporus biennis]|nr:GPR1/FUN34/yaaH family-domain-containing protein [Abortiporus biennis]
MSHIEKAEQGSFGTVDATTPQQAFARVPSRRFANPGPMGVFAFSATTLLLSLYNAQAQGVKVPNVVVGMAASVGGLVQFVAGMWEVATGNTFGATVFSLYGGFWMSYAALFIPSSGILAAYDDHEMLANALGLYLLTWFIITFLFFIGTTRRSYAFMALFGALDITFLFLALSELLAKPVLARAGGGFGILTAVIGFYIGTSEILRDDFWIDLPLGVIPKNL